MKKLKLFGSGLLVGLTTLSIALASVPRAGRVTDDTAIYQKLSEIRVAKEADLNFDGDLARLRQLEGRYDEKLPRLASDPRLAGPMNRIAQQKYKYAGSRKAVGRR